MARRNPVAKFMREIRRSNAAGRHPDRTKYTRKSKHKVPLDGSAATDYKQE